MAVRPIEPGETLILPIGPMSSALYLSRYGTLPPLNHGTTNYGTTLWRLSTMAGMLTMARFLRLCTPKAAAEAEATMAVAAAAAAAVAAYAMWLSCSTRLIECPYDLVHASYGVLVGRTAWV